MYIVKYSIGEWDDYRENTIFVTSNKEFAENYVNKLNSLVEKWVSFYESIRSSKYDRFMEVFFDRWFQLEDFNYSWIEEIEVR